MITALLLADAPGTTKLTILPPLQIPLDLQREEPLKTAFISSLHGWIPMFEDTRNSIASGTTRWPEIEVSFRCEGELILKT
jgi:hypothetical protein